jgi:hypothetical protein
MEEEGKGIGIDSNNVDTVTGERRPTVADIPPEARRVTARELLTLKSGPIIYFLVCGDECVYVGQTKRPRSRMRRHADLKEFDEAFYLDVAEGELDSTERRWIASLSPRLNVLRYKPKPPPTGRGRPLIYGGQTKMKSLRFPVEDWEQWAAYVKANGGSITGLIVKAVNEHLARKRRKGG